MKISIVIPVMNEDENVKILYQELTSMLSSVADGAYELIFVDDGSRDNTFAVLEALHRQDDKVKVIQFRRNFGKSAALRAGFELAQGEIIFTMDGDLQDNPVDIPHFLEKLQEGYDLVSGWKYPRHDPLTKTVPSRVWNLLVSTTTGVKLHDFNCGFKVYRREVLEEVCLYGELYRYLPVLAYQKGYTVTEIAVSHRPRLHGKSKFGFRRFARGFFDLMTILFLSSYSWRPLHLFGWLGSGFLGAGGLINLYLTMLWFTGHGPIGERPLLMLGVLLMVLGAQFFSIGLLAEMFTVRQARDLDLYSVRRRLE